MTDREMDELEDTVPAIAIAALNAASARAAASGVPRVLLIDGGLYRIDGAGNKELIRMLPPWTKAADLTGPAK